VSYESTSAENIYIHHFFYDDILISPNSKIIIKSNARAPAP